ncbi:hypothetical protein V6N12_007732 [Hibiscus sabdariffa]|uniref:RNase H type-1 domain-containing protein n=1 Tax=Hibiscus sabdariffa TaxID=183260 RepID=A0ABR2F2N0_9ROSI
MEHLGHYIHSTVDARSWHPFRFTRLGTPLSHLFFVDDLILYTHDSINQANVIDSILGTFSTFSGHRRTLSPTSYLFAVPIPWILITFVFGDGLLTINLRYAQPILHYNKIPGMKLIPHGPSYDFWSLSPSALLSRDFWTSNIPTWLMNNLKSRTSFGIDEISWPIFFAVSIWLIWKNRNNAIFNFASSQPADIYRRAQVLSRYICSASTLPHAPHPAIVATVTANRSWRPANIDWVILNTDGYRLYQLQSDCLQVVNQVNAPDASICQHSLVRATMLLSQAWATDIIWIPRDANKPVDFLAKMALGASHNPTILDVPPPGIERLISLDMEAAI